MKSRMVRKVSCKNYQMRVARDGVSAPNKILEAATASIQKDQPVPSSYDALLSRISHPLKPQVAKELCDRLEIQIDVHTRDILEQFKRNDLESMHFLRQMNECWKTNRRQLTMIRCIFSELDRTYVTANASTLSIWRLGVEKFRHYFSSNTIVQKRTVTEILKLVEQERRGEQINRSLVRELLGMLSTLSLYKDIFEPEFLEETRCLYRKDSERLVRESEVPEYLKYVQDMINEETTRSAYYLESITRAPLILIVESELIVNHLSTLLAKGLDQMMDDLRMDDLRLLYNLCKRVTDGLTGLCSHLNKYIKKRGNVIVTNPDKDKTMVQELLNFKEIMDRVLDECFNREERFIYTLKEAFEHFINLRQNKPAELIAKFVDSKLKSGNKEASEDELERILDKILVLFRFIHGKDVFEAFYKKDLAKRLLVNKSASVDAEKSMLSKLKQECGAAFTSKLEGMFKDIELSSDMMSSFKHYLASQKINGPIDMYVRVLTMGYWPTYQPVDVNFPDFLRQHQEAFRSFYTTKYHGRKLQWQPNLGYCTLIAVFSSDPSKKYEIVVSLYQALVLLLFNNKDELFYDEIFTATKIEPIELKRTLQSLACGKIRILVKEPRGKDVNESDKFIFYKMFKYRLYKIKINQVQLKETQEEQTMTEERVFQDRQYQIDAAIVRIMKTRKRLSHTSLAAEVFEHLRFPVRGHDLKVRIESLIERDYLNRSQENPDEYKYVA